MVSSMHRHEDETLLANHVPQIPRGVGIMNKLYLAAAALLTAMTLTGPALAADMPLKMPVKAPPPAPVCVWCGWYVGLNAGADWGHADKTFIANGLFAQDPNFPFFDVAGSPSFRKTNFSGGGQFGVNSQWWGPWVVGAETDIEYIGLRGSRIATFTGKFPIGGEEVATFNESIRDNWVSTSRIRFGYAQDYWMIYGTAGIAVSRQELSQFISIPNFSAGGGLEQEFTVGVASGGSHSKYVGGFAGGGGLEWKFAPNWSIRGEDIWIDLRRSEFDTAVVCTSGGPNGLCPPAPVGFSTHHEVHMWTNIARFAINYQFPVNAPFLAPTRY
jgi:outer membrane immunogenic protein